MSQTEDERADALLTALGAQARAEDIEVARASVPLPTPARADRMFDAAFAALGVRSDEAPPAVIPLRLWRRPVVWGAGLAAAAAVIAMLVWPTAPTGLPDYALEAGAGDQLQRGAQVLAERARYSLGARVVLVARPAVAATDVEARVYLRHADTLTRVDAPMQIGATGAVRIDAIAGETLLLPEGESTLIILVRPAGASTSDVDFISAENPSPARRLEHSLSFSSAPR